MGLLDRFKVKSFDNGLSSFFRGLSAPNELSSESYLEQYKNFTFACVSAIAQEIGKVELFVERKTKDGWVRDDSHPFYKVLQRPNSTTSGFMLRELTGTYIELAGEAFWVLDVGEKSRQIAKIRVVPDPSMVSIAVNSSGDITGYTIQSNGIKVPFTPDEILHIKTPNPTNPYRGKGAIEAAGLYIQTEDYVAKFSRNFIFNNGTPSGILNIKGTMTQDEFDRVKAKFTKDYGTLGASPEERADR